jgi:hypothetical protein
MIFSLIKYLMFTVVILLASQIKVYDKRVCDHVGDLTASVGIAEGLKELGKRVNFAQQPSDRPSADIPERDRQALSGILKERRSR